MGIVITPESPLGIEMSKWEKPFRFEMFPMMVYRAQKLPSGKVVTAAPMPHQFGWKDPAEYQRAVDEAEAITKASQRIVKDETELRHAKNNGWRETQAAALEAFELEEQALGNAAAEAAYQVKRMSEKAQAEYRAADEATHEHVADVPAPRKRPGRKPKAAETVSA